MFPKKMAIGRQIAAIDTRIAASCLRTRRRNGAEILFDADVRDSRASFE
jgi:hypothetical protein